MSFFIKNVLFTFKRWPLKWQYNFFLHLPVYYIQNKKGIV